jgi:GNAT superfamily N-acetyltransferase
MTNEGRTTRSLRHVVVGYDGSRNAAPALDRAGHEAAPGGSALHGFGQPVCAAPLGLSRRSGGTSPGTGRKKMCPDTPSPQLRVGVMAMARDGVAHHIRDASPDDRASIRLLFDDLSPRSTYQRFLSASPRGGELYAEVLFDPCRTLDAMDATAGGELVAVGSTHRMSIDSAELALTIVDRHQGHGVGTLLLESLIERARARGLARLVGEVLMANEQMLDVIRHLGLPFTMSVDEGVVEIVFDVRGSASYDEARARRARVAVGGSREVKELRTPFRELGAATAPGAVVAGTR